MRLIGLAVVLLAMVEGAQAQGLLAYVTGVPTGDALYASVDGRIETVRYIGIREPEILHPTRGREPYEEVAREVNRQLVEGRWVTLMLDAQRRDRYGQLLAYVYVGNRFVNADLVHRGYAEAATYPPNVQYQAYFLGLEQGARAAGRGLWVDRSAQAHYRPRPPDEETEVGGLKSFLFSGEVWVGVGSPGTGGSGTPPPPKVPAPSTTPRGGTNIAPPMRRGR